LLTADADGCVAMTVIEWFNLFSGIWSILALLEQIEKIVLGLGCDSSGTAPACTIPSIEKLKKHIFNFVNNKGDN
jgi:hypothetical protein